MILDLFGRWGLPTTNDEMCIPLLCVLRHTHSTHRHRHTFAHYVTFLGEGAVKVRRGPRVYDPRGSLIIRTQNNYKRTKICNV